MTQAWKKNRTETLSNFMHWWKTIIIAALEQFVHTVLRLADTQVRDVALIQGQTAVRWQNTQCFHTTTQPYISDLFLFSYNKSHFSTTTSSVTGRSPKFLSGCVLTESFPEQKRNLELTLKTQPWKIKFIELSCYKEEAKSCQDRTNPPPEACFLALCRAQLSGAFIYLF